MQITKYIFQQHGDHRGQLVVLEELKDIPFPIRRVYYMYDTGMGVRRGFHAHKSLKQILICIHGSCKILLDNGTEKETVTLDKPYEGLYISHNRSVSYTHLDVYKRQIKYCSALYAGIIKESIFSIFLLF